MVTPFCAQPSFPAGTCVHLRKMIRRCLGRTPCGVSTAIGSHLRGVQVLSEGRKGVWGAVLFAQAAVKSVLLSIVQGGGGCLFHSGYFCCDINRFRWRRSWWCRQNGPPLKRGAVPFACWECVQARRLPHGGGIQHALCKGSVGASSCGDLVGPSGICRWGLFGAAFPGMGLAGWQVLGILCSKLSWWVNSRDWARLEKKNWGLLCTWKSYPVVDLLVFMNVETKNVCMHTLPVSPMHDWACVSAFQAAENIFKSCKNPNLGCCKLVRFQGFPPEERRTQMNAW